jgi:hypothetical protein
MSKRITTRWFIGAWIVAVLAGIVMGVIARNAQGSSPPPGLMVAYLIAVAAGLVMFVMWIGALIKLGQQRTWGWFAFMLLVYVLTLGVLGIIPMVAYALAGHDDTGEVAIRPTTT